MKFFRKNNSLIFIEWNLLDSYLESNPYSLIDSSKNVFRVKKMSKNKRFERLFLRIDALRILS